MLQQRRSPISPRSKSFPEGGSALELRPEANPPINVYSMPQLVFCTSQTVERMCMCAHMYVLVLSVLDDGVDKGWEG